MIRGSLFQLFLQLFWKCSPTISSYGMMLARAQSWTSSSKRVSSLLRLQFGHPNASSLRMILRSRNPLPKPRGTRPGERGTRCCSQRPRPARPTMDPKHQEAKLTKTLESRQQNGRRSHRSSTMGSVVFQLFIGVQVWRLMSTCSCLC